MPAPKKVDADGACQDQAIGRSRGGVHQDTRDGRCPGQPGRLALSGGQACDLAGTDHLLPCMDADTLIVDQAFDADKWVLEPLAAAGKTAVIPSKANRRVKRDHDRHLYKARHLIENVCAKLKQFRAITIRYDKTARNFLGAVHLAAAAI